MAAVKRNLVCYCSARFKLRELHGMRASVEARQNVAMFGASLAEAFRAPAYDCRVVGSDDRPEFAVTRIRSGPREMEMAPAYPPDRAVLICVSLTPISARIGSTSRLKTWRSVYDRTAVAIKMATTVQA